MERLQSNMCSCVHVCVLHHITTHLVNIYNDYTSTVKCVQVETVWPLCMCEYTCVYSTVTDSEAPNLRSLLLWCALS